MFLYHFCANGYRHGADEFCVDDAAAEQVAFEMFIDLSACAKRVVMVTVTDIAGAEVLRVPRLSEIDISSRVRPG